jgi:hypothetical protein
MHFEFERAFPLRNFASSLCELCGLASILTAKAAKVSQRAAKDRKANCTSTVSLVVGQWEYYKATFIGNAGALARNVSLEMV